MNIRTKSGQRGFYQWDSDQVVVVEGAGDCQELHFCRRGDPTAMVCKIREVDGQRVADVPNILLQKDDHITAYLYSTGPDGRRTRFAMSFDVRPRPRPADYVYTETEVLNYESLDKRITDLEENGGASSWNDLKDRPFYDGEAEKVVLPEKNFSLSASNKIYNLEDRKNRTFEPNKVYFVLLDGVRYECPAFDLGTNGGFTQVGIGNPAIAQKGEDNGIPFCIRNSMDADGDWWYLHFERGEAGEAVEHTILIAVKDEVIYPIDPKYLPEPDMVITLPNTADTVYGAAIEGAVIASGTYSEVCAKIFAGEIVDVRVRSIANVSDVMRVADEVKARAVYYSGYLNIVYTVTSINNTIYVNRITIAEDNTITYVKCSRVSGTSV